MTTPLKKALAGLALAATLSASALADPVTLGALAGGATIQAGDKLFDQWSYSIWSSDGRDFSAENIVVDALHDGGLDPGPGLQFSAIANALSVTGDGVYAFVDLSISFHLTVLDPALWVKDNLLQLTGGSLGWSGDGDADLGFYIRETIGTAPGLNDLGQKWVEFSILGNTQTNDLSDSATFAPQRDIWITKNILVWAVDPTDTAELTGFMQRYSQTREVPEPGALMLLSLALAALALTRRRPR